jgi:acyl-CoA reductase-like NAD-dependent aldehyde dehydrogenase
MTDASPTLKGAPMINGGEDVAAHSGEWLETLDVGKPPHEARVDVGHAERLFRFYGEIADKSDGVAWCAAQGDGANRGVLGADRLAEKQHRGVTRGVCGT